MPKYFISKKSDPCLHLIYQGQSISEIVAIHKDFNEDRVWAFGCEANPAAVENCMWSDFANDWDSFLDFTCPIDGFVAGWQSVHDNFKEDRRSNKLHYISTLHYVTFSCFTLLPNVTHKFYYITPRFMTLSFLTLLHIMQHYFTLDYVISY